MRGGPDDRPAVEAAVGVQPADRDLEVEVGRDGIVDIGAVVSITAAPSSSTIWTSVKPAGLAISRTQSCLPAVERGSFELSEVS
jgi:hypothetical protein